MSVSSGHGRTVGPPGMSGHLLSSCCSGLLERSHMSRSPSEGIIRLRWPDCAQQVIKRATETGEGCSVDHVFSSPCNRRGFRPAESCPSRTLMGGGGSTPSVSVSPCAQWTSPEKMVVSSFVVAPPPFVHDAIEYLFLTPDHGRCREFGAHSSPDRPRQVRHYLQRLSGDAD